MPLETSSIPGDMTMNGHYKGPAIDEEGNDSPRVSPFVLPLLTTRCLATAAIFQGLGMATPAFSALLPVGLLLSVIGLGAYACVTSGRIHNGWAFLGLVPVIGILVGYTVLRFRQPSADGPLNALRGAVHAMLVGLVLIVSVALVWNFAQQGSEVRGEVPEYFPILAVVPDDDSSHTAHIVPKKKFDKFAKEHPDISYLVPKHLEAVLHESIRGKQNDWYYPAYFEVSEMSANRQAFKVRYQIHPEAYSVGWYEATERGIEPKRYFFYHEMMSGIVIFPGLGIAAFVYSLLAWSLKRWFWPRFAMADNKVLGK